MLISLIVNCQKGGFDTDLASLGLTPKVFHVIAEPEKPSSGGALFAKYDVESHEGLVENVLSHYALFKPTVVIVRDVEKNKILATWTKFSGHCHAARGPLTKQ